MFQHKILNSCNNKYKPGETFSVFWSYKKDTSVDI